MLWNIIFPKHLPPKPIQRIHQPIIFLRILRCDAETVRILSTGEPVARQTRRLLQAADALAPDDRGGLPRQAPLLLTTGPVAPLQTAAARWLQLPASCCRSVTVPVTDSESNQPLALTQKAA